MLVPTSFGLGAAVALDLIAYWMLLVASGLQAATCAFYLPAQIAFIAELVDLLAPGHAVVLNQTSQEAMRVLAPALAGLLIGPSWFGVGGASCSVPP
jgi:hypothetical protein